MELTWEFTCPRHGPTGLTVETATGRIRCGQFRGRTMKDLMAAAALGDPCRCSIAVTAYRHNDLTNVGLGEAVWWRRLSALPSFRRWQRCRVGRELRAVRVDGAKSPERVAQRVLEKGGLFQVRFAGALQLSADGERWWSVSFSHGGAGAWAGSGTARLAVTVGVGANLPTVVVPFSPNVATDQVRLAATVEAVVFHAHVTFTEAYRTNRSRLAGADRLAGLFDATAPPFVAAFVEHDEGGQFKVKLNAGGLSPGETRLLLTRTAAALETIRKSRSRRTP